MNESNDQMFHLGPKDVEFAAGVQELRDRAVRLALRPSLKDLQNEVSEISSALFVAHEKLGKVFQWHGETIKKRW